MSVLWVVWWLVSVAHAALLLTDGNVIANYPRAWYCGWNSMVTYNATNAPTPAPMEPLASSSTVSISARIDSYGGYSLCSSEVQTAVSVWLNGGASAKTLCVWVTTSDRIILTIPAQTWTPLVMDFGSVNAAPNAEGNYQWVVQMCQGWGGPQPQPALFLDNIVADPYPAYRCDSLFLVFTAGGPSGNSVVSPALVVMANTSYVSPPSTAPGSVPGPVMRQGRGTVKFTYPTNVPILTSQASQFFAGVRFWVYGSGNRTESAKIEGKFLDSVGAPVGWTQEVLLADPGNATWREVRLAFSQLQAPAQIYGFQLQVININNYVYLDRISWYAAFKQPICFQGLVYVPKYLCPTFTTAGVPANLVSQGLGRCPTAYNDSHWCGGWQPSWSPNVLENTQGQFQFTSHWTVTQGTFSNNGIGKGFASAGTQNSPAKRSQQVDLLAKGFTAPFLAVGPPVQLLVWLRPTPTNVTGAQDVYRYAITLLDGSNQQLAARSGSVSVIGPTLVNVLVPSVGIGGLKSILFEDQGFDDQNAGGPTIENVVIMLNLNECDDNNGGCDPHRTCLDQLSPPAVCGSCFTGYLEGPASSCILINQCALGSKVCPPFSTCNLDAYGNATCICNQGFYLNGGLCLDINECLAGNATNGNCGSGARCQNFVGATTTTPVCLPFPINCSLSVNGGAASCTPHNLPNNAGGQTLSLNFVGSPAVTNIRFGPPADPLRFTCANYSFINSSVSCVLPQGSVGTNLAFTVTLCTASTNCGPTNLCCFDISTRSSGTFRFPLPTFTPNTLRFFPSGTGISPLQSNTSFGDLVVLNGFQFLADSMFSRVPSYAILMRSVNNSQILTCSLQAGSNASTTICQTPPGFGLDFFFQIVLDETVLANSSDTYSYPTSPVILTVRGCPFNVSYGTGGCPTAGGIPIVITGGYFGSGAIVSVGGLNCPIVKVTGSTQIICTLPALTGFATVTVALGSLYSLPVAFVTYAAPIIDSVWGCPRQSGNLSALDCARNGSSVLTVRGNHFGSGPPLILVGQTTCMGVTVLEPHSLVSCTIPAGMNTDVGVLFVQAGGFQAAPPYPSLSYYQCPAGFASANITCLACLAGTFTQAAGQQECVACPGGFVSDDAASRCDACGPGHFAHAGWGTCQPCNPGYYSPASGQSECAQCLPGTFTNLTRQASCRSCPEGRSQFEPGKDHCSECLLGTYANFFGYTSCALCPVGKFTNTVGTVDCRDCPPGTSQPKEAAVGCIACLPGAYAPSHASRDCDTCEAGSYSLGNSTSCLLCNAGFHQSNLGQSACSPCPAGTESRSSGRSACDSCLVGRFAAESVNGTVACSFCAGGRYQPNIGQSLCLLCSPGRVNEPDFRSCSQCETGRYTASPGSSLCHTCSPGSVPDSLSIGCICPTGTFARIIHNGAIACESCPLGAVCTQPGIVFEALETKPGFWRPSVDSVSYYRCKVPDLCLGGHNSSCDGFRTGPVCGVCLDGYAAGGPDKTCGKCPEQSLAWGYTILIFLALLLVMVICLYLVLRFLNLQQRKLILYTRAMDAANAEKMKSTLESFGPNEEYFMQMRKNLHDAEEDPSVTPVAEDTDEDESRKAGPTASLKGVLVFFDSLAASRALNLSKHTQQRAPNFIYKCKILLGFFQVASIMPLNGVVSWPRYWSQFISVFTFFNFDFVPWETLGCAASVTYLQKAIIVGCIPLAAVIVIALVVWVSLKCSRDAGLEHQMMKQQAQERAWTQFVKLVLFTVFLLYPFTSKMTLGVYNCVHVEGISYLAADFSVQCTGSTYWNYAGANFVFVLAYPIGIPVTYFLLLRSIRAQLRDPHTILLYGFLYDAYRPECWYWEILDMLHKLLLTSALLFLPINLILGACMLTVQLYLIGLLLVHPYIRKGDDRFHLLVQCNLYFLALVGLILSTVPDPYASTTWSPEALQTLLSLLLIAINIGLFVGFFIIAGRNLWKIYKNARGETGKVVPVPKRDSADGFIEHSQHDEPSTHIQPLRPATLPAPPPPTLPAPPAPPSNRD